ncbi:MAG: succinate dehydrogenase assembly factor 2 [Pseudomonadota bacterium]
MDLILGSFADEWLDKFTAEQIESYEALLVENDPDIYNWVTKREPPPAHVQGSVFDLLIDHVDHAEGTG